MSAKGQVKVMFPGYRVIPDYLWEPHRRAVAQACKKALAAALEGAAEVKGEG